MQQDTSTYTLSYITPLTLRGPLEATLIYKLTEGPTTWSRKKQPTISHSTIEAEYKALLYDAQEVVYLKHLIEKLEWTFL